MEYGTMIEIEQATVNQFDGEAKYYVVAGRPGVSIDLFGVARNGIEAAAMVETALANGALHAATLDAQTEGGPTLIQSTYDGFWPETWRVIDDVVMPYANR